MYLLCLLLPALNLLLSCSFGKFIGKYSKTIIIFNMFLCVLVSLFIFYEVGLNSINCIINLGDWFKIGVLRVEWLFVFDSITSIMIFLVVLISLFVHLYSIDYMSHDPHVIRFLSYLSLFTFFMLMLVTAGNYVQLFLGWEGVGLSSYLLINFWYTRVQANKSAMKAIIVNRFGDFGIYFALLLMFFFFKSFDFGIVFAMIPFFQNTHIMFMNHSFNSIDLISFFLFAGAIGKSAQLGLHTWLPDAMEGPTPVSALIHAATMVTAGVFVVIRSSPILEFSNFTLFLISTIGGLTAFFAGTAGLVQNDIKKVIAYSTCSQLGYMFLACGLSNYSIAFFHLFNHGFFKALLFLGAGSIIHSLLDEQDMRKMGGMLILLPITYTIIVVGSLSLTGFPFLAGFYSKEVILEIAFVKYGVNSFFLYWLGVFSAFITSFYSFRLLYLVFLSGANSRPSAVSSSHESKSFIFYVIFVLAFISIFVGFIFRDLFIGIGTNFWNNSIYQNYFNQDILHAEFIDYNYKLIPLIFSFGGLFFSYIFYLLTYNLSILVSQTRAFEYLYWFLVKKWYFDLIYNNLFVFNLLNAFYTHTFKLVDRGFIEVLGPLSITRYVNKASMLLSLLQTGHMYNYIFLMMLSIVIFISIIMIKYYMLVNFRLILILIITLLLILTNFKAIDKL